MKAYFNVLSYVILMILFYFSKGCQDDEILKGKNSCISIEKLLRDPSEKLEIDEINYLSRTIKSINKTGYEIDFIRLDNKDLQSKNFTKSKIYISKSCINLLGKNFNIGISQGMVMIVSNYNKTNKNGLPENFFVIRYDGSGSNKYINSTTYDFSICNKDPILLNMSIKIDDLKAFKKKEKKNAYSRDSFELVDINIDKVLYAEKNGIDVFNFDSRFFEDICFKFTSELNTDVTLETRTTDYYQNVTFCNNKLNAYYQSTNYESENKILYYCCVYGFYKDDEDKQSYLDKIDAKMNIAFSNSNFKVVSCYKDILKKDIKKNYGLLICLFVILMQLIFFMTFCCKGVEPLREKITTLLEKKPAISPIFQFLQEQQNMNNEKINNGVNSNTINNNIPINNLNYNNIPNSNPNNNNIFNNDTNLNQACVIDIKNDINENPNLCNQKSNNNYTINSEDLESNIDSQSKNEMLPSRNVNRNNAVSNPPRGKKKRQSVILPQNNNQLAIKEDENNLQQNNRKKRRKSLSFRKKNQELVLENIEKGDVEDDKKTYLPDRILNEEEKKAQEERERKQKEEIKEAEEDKKEAQTRQKIIRRRSSQLFAFDDYELNELSFDEAKMFDNRSCCKYYGFMITISNIIINIFRFNDFNLITIKLGLLLLLFPINLAFNALFFTSSALKSVYINKISDISVDWKYLGRSFAPSIVSSIILIIFKLLALSHNSIRSIKKEETIEKVKEKSICIMRCVKFRICLYFILSLIFLVLLTIYIGSFCSIFENTQLLLIKNMVFSWVLSLIYPFFICIITSIFRVCSLRGRKRGYSCCFAINKILQMI